MLMKGVRIL